jgi:hypothetical protein
MKTYSEKDLTEIRRFSPVGSVARVVELRHLRHEKYVFEKTSFFSDLKAAWIHAAEFGAECNLPEHYGTAAFSDDGKKVRLLTVFA